MVNGVGVGWGRGAQGTTRQDTQEGGKARGEDKAIPPLHPLRQGWACCLQNPTFTAFTEANFWWPPSPGSCCVARDGGATCCRAEGRRHCLRLHTAPWGGARAHWERGQAKPAHCLRLRGRSAGRAPIPVRPGCPAPPPPPPPTSPRKGGGCA